MQDDVLIKCSRADTSLAIASVFDPQSWDLEMTTSKYRKKRWNFSSDVASVYQKEEEAELEAAKKRKKARLASKPKIRKKRAARTQQ